MQEQCWLFIHVPSSWSLTVEDANFNFYVHIKEPFNESAGNNKLVSHSILNQLTELTIA